MATNQKVQTTCPNKAVKVVPFFDTGASHLCSLPFKGDFESPYYLIGHIFCLLTIFVCPAKDLQ